MALISGLKQKLYAIYNILFDTGSQGQVLQKGVSGFSWADNNGETLSQTAIADASNVGRTRYYTDASFSYYEVCMEISPGTYDWVVLSQQSIV